MTRRARCAPGVRWPCALRAALLLAVLTVACSEPSAGPVRIVWGRHTCDHCRMAISEPRYAAELRLGPRETRRFDDPGCALLWLEANGGPERATEFWVMGEDGETWLDARSARFRPGQRTPMAYGFGAIASARAKPGDVDLATARAEVLRREHERDTGKRR